MKVTISGTPGSGKTSVGKMLANKLGYAYFDVGQLRRDMASERGITLFELNEIGKAERWTDEEADAKTKNIGETQDDFIFVGRLTYHFIPDAVKIYLTCDVNEAAKRIFLEKREKELFNSIEEAKERIIERQEKDVKRYIKWYDLDVNDTSKFDLILDTTAKTIDEVLVEILKVLEKYK